jgi:hypothetical protein
MKRFVMLGFTDIEGKMAPKEHGPFIIGGRSFIGWHPATLDYFAQPFGENFKAENAIEFSLKNI